MRYRVLGPLEVGDGGGGAEPPRGAKQRRLLAALLLHAPRVVSADRLALLLWPRDVPADAAAALQTQVSRLRAFLRAAGAGDPVVREPYGYRLALEADEVDAARFARLVAQAREAPTPEAALARLDEALALWRGDAYEEFADAAEFLGEAARLRELRTAALERRAECLLALGRTGEALAACEPLVREDPLRDRPRALHMEALYRGGRQGEALETYEAYRRLLRDELGLDPPPALRQLKTEILRHERALAPSGAPAGEAEPEERLRSPLLRVSFAQVPGGGRIAWAESGRGSPMLALPAWVSSLAAVGAGTDPRSAFLARMAERFRLVLFDRVGMGLSAGPADDFSVDADVAQAVAVMDAAGVERATVLAVSQAGPPALALAARHPDRVARLVLLGTYASGPRTFRREDLRDTMLALVRAHWGIGSKVLADLLVPDATAEEAVAFARVQRESAPPEQAARALEQFYAADVTALLAAVRCPALVVHYTGDRAIPFQGGQELAALLPDARLAPLDARAHLPRDADLDRLAELIDGFTAG